MGRFPMQGPLIRVSAPALHGEGQRAFLTDLPFVAAAFHTRAKAVDSGEAKTFHFRNAPLDLHSQIGILAALLTSNL